MTEIFDEEKIKEEERLVNIGAYCLMPNHFHILLKEKEEGGVSKFILKLQTSYSMYFNIKNGRSGNLFQGKFKAKYVDDDEHLRYLFAYIHLNPVKIKDPENWEQKIIPNPAQAKKYLNNYRFSSYPHYLGEKRKEDVILNPSVFPEYFETKHEFSEFINDWINFIEL